MLGRLRMTIDQCLAAYKELSEGIFGAGMLEKTKDASGTGARYNADKLVAAIKKYVELYSESKDPETLMLDPREDSCKV
jgi:hypothetical protein